MHHLSKKIEFITPLKKSVRNLSAIIFTQFTFKNYTYNFYCGIKNLGYYSMPGIFVYPGLLNLFQLK